MLYNAKNGTLRIGGTTIDYIRFGTGERILVMLPGLGDGLRSMKGTALPMAFMYREFAKDFTVYAFSRKMRCPRDIPPGIWPGIRQKPWSSWASNAQISSACPWAA